MFAYVPVNVARPKIFATLDVELLVTSLVRDERCTGVLEAVFVEGHVVGAHGALDEGAGRVVDYYVGEVEDVPDLGRGQQIDTPVGSGGSPWEACLFFGWARVWVGVYVHRRRPLGS